MNVFIGGAWPYANGSLHLGHIASLLPGDILARYFRLKGDHVLYVSGSDCNGTPIAIKAKQEGVSTKKIADQYHNEFRENFNQLGFSYDCYTRTDTKLHHEVVQDLFLKLLEKNKIYKKEVKQCYCNSCEQHLPDRFVEGNCPHCHQQARGDQCDHCSNILDPLELLNRKCKVCEDTPVTKNTEHFYFELSSLQNDLEQYVLQAKTNNLWRDNAIQLTERYLKEGLHDRAVSRDLPNGVSVPVEGYRNKKIYVWIEAVSGYYSASKQWSQEKGTDNLLFWNDQTISYYVHGKDNIPFHSIIWPAILKSTEIGSLPTHIVSNEYLTIEQKKLSTSRNWAVWLPKMIENYHPDSIRYFLTVNAPENRDADFSWREFVYSHNSELLGAYGNFVNRTLKFINKYYDGKAPIGKVDPVMRTNIIQLYEKVGSLISNTRFKESLEEVFTFVRYSNKYFDEKKPWVQIKENEASCDETMANCLYIIANLAQLLHPFLPFSSEEVKKMLSLDAFKWEEIELNSSTSLKNVRPLFERIDVGRIEEVAKLNEETS
ncbi:methionine--tRNA ligase [Salipaludibacillus keqinensis]|uniref:Methionine--tRNA ligase n=1 Tax=Salipaludibacillus keqinensis TaxID=2045207 RepID=A0A323TD42_9BACI|nr:methionine--tRNA ligase [Salipaludibacillus keqinensis]PYZ93031.1 methionine--tRNA ligase [Salipaludibacillus keqinensis]